MSRSTQSRSPGTTVEEQEEDGLLDAVERETVVDASAAKLSPSGRNDLGVATSSSYPSSPPRNPRLARGEGGAAKRRASRKDPSAEGIATLEEEEKELPATVERVIHESASASTAQLKSSRRRTDGVASSPSDRSLLIRKSPPRSPTIARKQEGANKRRALGKEGPNGQELAPFAKIEEPEYVLMAATPLAPDETQEDNSVLSSRWNMILPELLKEIQKFLSVKESTRMKCVCKNWCNSTPCYFLADHPMWFVPNMGKMLFGSPGHERMFSVKHDHQLPTVEYLSASQGLVTFLEGKNIWVLNVIRGFLNKLPDLDDDAEQISQAISWNIVSDMFATFAISGCDEEVTISLYWRPIGWMSRRYQCQNPFFPAENSAPVVKENSVYCLGENGQIGIYNLESRQWRVEPPSITWPLLVSHTCHLVSTPKAINAVIVNTEGCGHPPIILRLDMNKREWDIIRSLGGWSAFTGGRSTSSFIDSSGSFMRNRIYLPFSRGYYILIEASIVVSEGQTFFRVEDESTANLKLCWFLLDDSNVIQGRPGQPSRKRHRDSFKGDQALPYGTWLNFNKRISEEEILMTPAGPPTRPNQELLSGITEMKSDGTSGR